MKKLGDLIISCINNKLKRRQIIVGIKHFGANIFGCIRIDGLLVTRGEENFECSKVVLKIAGLSFVNRFIKVKAVLEKVSVCSRQIAVQPVLINEMDLLVYYVYRNKSIKIKGKLPYDLSFSLDVMKNTSSVDYLFELNDFSILKFKKLFQGHIISEFLQRITDDTLIKIKASYQYENQSRFPKFCSLIQSRKPLKIEPSELSLDKFYLISQLQEKHHLASIYREYSDIPDLIKGAVVSTEDPMFWRHKGISEVSLGMTLRKNINSHRLSVGGSSISQQLIKNSLLSPERTIFRKIEEAILTILMENYYNLCKTDILEIYLNMIELAPSVYGIDDGALYYFGKHCEALDIFEVLTLTYAIPRPAPFRDALIMKTDQLKRNLWNHIQRFYPTLLRKGIISGSVDNLKSIHGISFTPQFGYLQFL
jgi:hypothetical protein